MKKKVTGMILVGVLILLLTGVFLLVFLQIIDVDKDVEVEAKKATTYASYTEAEAFQNIPIMETKSGKVYDAEDYGDGNYLINVSGSTVEEYETYLTTLEENGFKKHSENGDDAMEGYALTASFTKDNVTVTVSHAVKLDHTYISASLDLPLSDHLIYDNSYVQNLDANAKTKVSLVQLNENGNSFVIQLKNGHFLIHDGGTSYDAPYLLDYLEELTPGEEKPVVEAWFISHAHGDHSGAMNEIAKDATDLNRLYVEGFYYTEPSTDVFSLLTMGADTQENWYITRNYRMFKSTSGEAPEMYRMQFGQRYYFCDITIDVSMTVEQFTLESYYSDDFNDTSTWLMHTIEGQKFLHAGDTHHTGMRVAMNLFDEEYFDVEVFAVFHHGINVWDYWTDYCTLHTVLYTAWRSASVWEPSRADLARVDENEHLRQSCEEYYSHGEGTVVLTFPYAVGEAEVLPSLDWKYNNGKPYRVNSWE